MHPFLSFQLTTFQIIFQMRNKRLSFSQESLVETKDTRMGYFSRPLILALLAILTKSEELNESGKSNIIADKLMQIETSSCSLLLHHC